MKKNDFILFYFMIILILFGYKISNVNNNDKSEESLSFSKNVLYLEEDKVYRLPIDTNGYNNKDIIYLYNEGIIKIEDKKITPIDVGHTTINAKLESNESINTSIDVYVVNKPELTADSNQLKVSDSEEISFANKGDVGLKRSDFNWTVSDESIAKIDENFQVKGLKDGEVTITATLIANPKISSSYTINVYTPKVDYAQKLVDVALAEEGYEEGPNNYTKYASWYGLPNEEWCAMFVSWSANKAGIETNVIPKFASVSAGKAAFVRRGEFEYKGDYTPKKGDIIFFLNDISHAGIVTRVEDGRVYTIEGNSAEKVAQRSYSLNDSSITGYGTPKY